MDATKNETVDFNNDTQMKRGLTNRMVQLIAIGGTIGTGLFLGAGKTIHLTGPSVLLIYLIVGAFMFVMMRAIGEMMYFDPSQHTFINFITKYLGRATGHFAGWSYWLTLTIVGMAEITAVSTYFVTFFQTFGIHLAKYAWLIQVGFLLGLVLINLLAVSIFGEAEFWFALIKITLIVGLIITGVVMVILSYHYQAVHISGSNTIAPAGAASLTNIINHFSLFPHGPLNFIIAFQMVFFAYQAVEFVGITTSETKDPRKVLPKAINQIPIRIFIFYIGALFAIMAIVKWTNFAPNADGSYNSPFIMVFQYAGANWASTLVFFVVLTSAASALNSILYSTGRHMYQLALDSNSKVMQRFRHVTKQGVPSVAILFSAACVMLSPLIKSIPAVSNAFTTLTSASTAVYIGIYMLLMVAHYKYRKSEDFMPDGFKMPAYKILNPLTIVFFALIYMTLFLSKDTMISAVGGVIWVVVFGLLSIDHVRREDKRAAINPQISHS